MMTCVAIDDELPALSVIETFCKQVDNIELKKVFNQPKEAIKFIEKFPVDVLFLDINMPSLSGIDLYKSVSQKTFVIFTTAYSEYAVEGFNLNAVDYLLKPFTLERFRQAVNKTWQLFQLKRNDKAQEKNTLVLRVNYGLIKLNPNNILYIEGLDDYLKIFLQNEKPVIVRMTMKSMLEKLSVTSFIRVHKSFIVNIEKITGVRNKTIFIQDNPLPLGSSYEAAFLAVFKAD